MKPRISVVINTFNEEKNLPYALRSVQMWADETVVVDMQSKDRTVEIARQFGAKVYLHEGPGFDYAPRQFAVAQASSEWIFVLDADELVPPALREDLKSIAETSGAEVILIPRKNYLLGGALNYTGWGPEQDLQTRFFRKDKICASSIAHQDFLPKAKAKVFKLPFRGNNAIIHFPYFDSAHFIEKLNRYTSIEAQQAMDRGERVTLLRAVLRAVNEFVTRYIRLKGYRDGWRGLYLSLFMSFYRAATSAKLKELEMVGSRDHVRD
ncbi:MAG: glycosyltransferase family 2 protein, partial [Candidatus Micrarchaeaceae archaeon]